MATIELAEAAELAPSTRVLDLGCGIGGPARYLTATFGCSMTGVDLSPGFIDAATYLTARCELSEHVNFQIGDALHLPFEDAAFDTVFLQHTAMNIEDRAAGLFPFTPLCSAYFWSGVSNLLTRPIWTSYFHRFAAKVNGR